MDYSFVISALQHEHELLSQLLQLNKQLQDLVVK